MPDETKANPTPPPAPAEAPVGKPATATPSGVKPLAPENIAAAKPAPHAAPKKEHEKAPSLKPEKPTDPTAIVVEELVDIAAPVESVWRLFLDYGKWRDWNPVCLGMKPLGQGTAFGLGWRFELRLKFGPLRLRFKPIILENTTPQVIRWLGGSAGIYGTHWFIFEKTETGSRVTSYEEFTGPLRWLIYPIRGWTRKMFRAWLEAMKAQVEKPAVADKKSPVLKPPG